MVNWISVCDGLEHQIVTTLLCGQSPTVHGFLSLFESGRGTPAPFDVQ